MYTPDRVFMKDLKQLDPRLGCYFNKDHNHFVVTYQRPVGKPAEVLLVERQSDGGFRQPDHREIDCLCEGDLHKTDVKARLQKGAAYMEQYREKQDKEIRESMRDATKDDRVFLKNAYRKATNTGSKAAEHRRITPKPKGEVF